MGTIAFRKVKGLYGWLGNMSAYPVTHGGVVWRTTEALFQALRLADGDPVRELIREQKSPMGAKMLAKSHAEKRVVVPLSDADLDLMRLVLRLKLEEHPFLKQELLQTDDYTIVEDCTARPHGTGLFWGAELRADGTWNGRNALGVLWMELREELRRNDGEQEEDRDEGEEAGR